MLVCHFCFTCASATFGCVCSSSSISLGYRFSPPLQLHVVCVCVAFRFWHVRPISNNSETMRGDSCYFQPDDHILDAPDDLRVSTWIDDRAVAATKKN